MKFTIANALTIIDKYKVENSKKMGMISNNLCNSCINVEVNPKDQYEARLKADMVAMLEEIQLEIEEAVKEEELIDKEWANGLHYSEKIIQQKINALRGEEDDKRIC